MKRLMTLINHLPPFFRSLNARVKYFFFITTMNQPLSFSFPSTATSLVQLPRSMISLDDALTATSFIIPTKLDVFFPPRKKLCDPFKLALFTTRSRFYCRLFRNLRVKSPIKAK